MKSKGTRGERELFHLFWNNDWGCIRTAGSGSTPLPAPDLLAGKQNRYLAIECKVLKSNTKYLYPEEIKELIEFAEKFSAEPWIAIKFDYTKWHFLQPKDLSKTKTGYYSIPKEFALKKGIKFEELIKCNLQTQ